MKKKILSVFLLFFIVCPLIMTACSARIKDIDDVSKRLNTYTIDAAYKDNTHSLAASESLNFTNRTGEGLDKICFNLYPNAYREDAVFRAISPANRAKAYPKGASYGRIEINYAKANGQAVEHKIAGEDKNILEVVLADRLESGDSIDIEISFITYLANVYDRLGWNEKTVVLSNFYPVVCVFRGGDFVIENYSPYGDPFFSEVANYNVRLTYPNRYNIAHTGEGTHQVAASESNTIDMSARCVRDFAVALSVSQEMVTTQAGKLGINYHYITDQNPEQSLALAVKAMEMFSDMFGDYPYPKVEIFETPFVHGGMEYSGLVLVATNLSKIERDEVIVHELCHQWWYGLVGNNQHSDAWIDEGLADFCTLLFFDRNSEYGIEKNKRVKQAGINYALFVDVLKSLNDSGNTTMTRKLLEYESEREYVFMTYTKGMLMFDAIEKVVGTKTFLKCLKRLYADNIYGVVTAKEVIAAFEKASHKKLGGIFRSWLDGKVVIARLAEKKNE